MTVSPQDAMASLQARARRRRADGEDRAAHLRARVPSGVSRLKRVHGATRVWLFGSLASDRFRVRSDVDLAVEGLPNLAYFPALADLMDLLDADVDLVRIVEACESLRERILAEGIEL